MKLKLELSKRLFFFVAPLVTGSVLTASIGQATTLARSDTFVDILNFSHNPETTSVSSVTFISENGSVISQANADTFFLNEPALALTDSSIEALGSEQWHLSSVRTESTIIGNFFIDVEQNYPQSFSFNFDAFLTLETSTDSSRRELASAATDIYLFLVDTTDRDNRQILDFFSISSHLTTTGEDTFPLYHKSNNFTLEHFLSFAEVGTGLQDEYADVQAIGSYSREFNSPTHLTLIGAKKTEVAVELQVPEPSSTLGLLLFGSLAGVCWASNVKTKKRQP